MTDASPELPPDEEWSLDLTGVVLDERYQIDELLGTGGMGAVYRGKQITLRKPVAIKLLRPEYAHRELYVRRFLREARAASMIGHRNVVEVTDFGQADGGRVYFVMEYLDGEDLAKRIKRCGALPWPEARHLLIQMVRALKAAHAKGVIHRDVKPANVFIAASDEEPDFVKVLDFGIAKVVDGTNTAEGLTSSQQMIGTAMYMAPEQAMGKEIDVRTDIYSLGAVAFQMLTGRVPFEGVTAFEVLMRRVNEPPPSLRAVVPSVPNEVDEIVRRAMARQPIARWQTMEELEGALLGVSPDAVGVGQVPVVSTPTDPGNPADTGPGSTADFGATATSSRHRVDSEEASTQTELYGPLTQARAAVASQPHAPVAAHPHAALTSSPEMHPGNPVATGAATPPKRSAVPLIIVVAIVVAVGLGLALRFGLGIWDDATTGPSEVAAAPSPSADPTPREPAAEPAPVAGPRGSTPSIDDAGPSPAVDDAGPSPAIEASPASDDPESVPPSQEPPQETPPVDPAPEVTPKPKASKPKAPPTTKQVLNGIRRKAKKCGGAKGQVVEFAFTPSGGKAYFPMAKPTTADAAVVACVKNKIKGATFPEGEKALQTVKVAF